MKNSRSKKMHILGQPPSGLTLCGRSSRKVLYARELGPSHIEDDSMFCGACLEIMEKRRPVVPSGFASIPGQVFHGNPGILQIRVWKQDDDSFIQVVSQPLRGEEFNRELVRIGFDPEAAGCHVKSEKNLGFSSSEPPPVFFVRGANVGLDLISLRVFDSEKLAQILFAVDYIGKLYETFLLPKAVNPVYDISAISGAAVVLDWMDSFSAAVELAGGKIEWDSVKDKPFGEVSELLARNGIRLKYEKDCSFGSYRGFAARVVRVLPLVKEKVR